jgi:hypothetical protein
MAPRPSVLRALFPSVLLQQGLLPVLDVVRDDARRLVGREVAADGLDEVAFWVCVTLAANTIHDGDARPATLLFSHTL